MIAGRAGRAGRATLLLLTYLYTYLFIFKLLVDSFVEVWFCECFNEVVIFRNMLELNEVL